MNVAHIRPMTHHTYTKMNGCKNTFVIFDGRTTPLHLTPQTIQQIAKDPQVQGVDQVIVIGPSEESFVDAQIIIYNADGSRAEACGNATRCVAHLLNPDRSQNQVTLKSNAGLLECTFPTSDLITVDMGRPKWQWDEIPLKKVMDTQNLTLHLEGCHKAAAVNVGNPHLILFYDTLPLEDFERLGAALEYDPLFPERINISFVQVISPTVLHLKVWERGVGPTKACGSAACATAAVAHRAGYVDAAVTIEQEGGNLEITLLPDQHILMTGPVELEFIGEINL